MMNLLNKCANLVPRPVLKSLGRIDSLRALYESLGLMTLRRANFDPSPLGKFAKDELQEVFNNSAWNSEWKTFSSRYDKYQLRGPSDTCEQDCQAIYHLARALRPIRVLEIGTYVGTTTAAWCHAASKISEDHPDFTMHIDTVDIVDVNDSHEGPWAKQDAICSPRDAIAELGGESFVTFHVADSLKFLQSCDKQYDLIFLDGDHSAHQVYQEIPLALKLLRSSGFILLHDYYPRTPSKDKGNRKKVIHGPYLGVRRLRRENESLDILPFGRYSWSDVAEDNEYTNGSLALVRSRNEYAALPEVESTDRRAA